MPQIRPITDLRNTNEISDICHGAGASPLFITKNGYGDLVVMSIETYEDLFETAATDARYCGGRGGVRARRKALRRKRSFGGSSEKNILG